MVAMMLRWTKWRRRHANGGAGDREKQGDTVVDLIPFIFVTDVSRSISFYEALGFRAADTYRPHGSLEFASLESTSAAKVMLARVDEVPDLDTDEPGRGFLYLYVRSLDALRERLLAHGFAAGEIEDGSPGPKREMCVLDPDGHGHMVAELAPPRG